MHAIRRCLVRCRASPELDETIAADYWFDLLYRKPWRLRAYQAQRGPLQAYLTGITRTAVLDFLAAERRQQLQTVPMGRLDRVAPEDTEMQEALEELLARLSKRERAALLSYLRSSEPAVGADTPATAACLRQRKKRVLHKALHILNLRPGPGKT